MTNTVSRKRSAGAVIILLAFSLPALIIYPPSKVDADPYVTDLGNGNKTASWNFSNPSDYAATNVDIAGRAGLSSVGGQLVHDTTQEFTSNGTWDTANLTVSGGSILTLENRKELVVNGNFDSAPSWNYMSSSDGNITAGWDSANETGGFSHNRLAAPMLSYDEMDTGYGSNWTASAGPTHVVNFAGHDNVTYIEYNASIKMDIDFGSSLASWVILQRIGGPWDWSLYETLSMWLNTDYAGPQNLGMYVHLESGASQWDSVQKHVNPGWNHYNVSISSFSNRGSTNRIEIRFTNITNTNNVNIWIDDIWLYHFENLTQTASISQDITKPDFTDPILHTVLLNFSYLVDSPANLTDANITVTLGGIWSSPTLPANTPLAWQQFSYNLSSFLSGTGTFNLSFILNMSFDTPFATSLNVQIDNVSVTVPGHHGGTYQSNPLDLGYEMFYDQTSWINSSHTDTSVTVQIRGGWSNNPLDGSWTSWTTHTPGILLGGGKGRYLQYRVLLDTTNLSASTSFGSIIFTFTRHIDNGQVDTFDFTPPEPLIGWRWFNSAYTTNPATTVNFFVSVNNGSIWTSVTSGQALDALTGPQIRVRADIATTNTTITPYIATLNITYEFRGPLFSIRVTPTSWSGTADDQTQFIATGRDSYGHNVQINPTWTEDDPIGTVDSTGLYRPGKIGNHHVCASAGGMIDCANVTVSHGALTMITLSPPTIIMQIGELKQFNASGRDADGNNVPLTGTQWSTNVGDFTEVKVNSSIFRALTIGVGYVRVKEGAIQGQASVTVNPSTLVYIQGTVPDQQSSEDSPPWSLDLHPYLPPGQSEFNLMWYLTGVNNSLYSIFGERRFGQHLLWFTPKRDAFGSDEVILWLEDRNGAKANQTMNINILPVNDAPIFYDVPILSVKYNSPYEFDYSPYVYDVDNSKSSLFLTTYDPQHTIVVGLKVNYTYDSNYIGQTVLVRLKVSDGQYTSETIQQINVMENTNPHIVKPLPEVIMQEDVMLDDAFPEKLSNYFDDADGDQLIFCYVSSHLTLEFWTNPPDYVHVRITPLKDWYGVEFLVIRAKDPSGSFVEQSVRVVVNPVNDAPMLAWYDDIFVKINVTYTLDLSDYITDVDDAFSDLTLSTNRSDLAFIESFMLWLTCHSQDIGNATSISLSMSLTDGKATTWSNITVYVGDNEPPILRKDMNLPDVTFEEDQILRPTWSLNSFFIDPDNPMQPLQYSINSTYIIASVDARDNTINFSAPQDWFGLEVVRIKASDGSAYTIARLTVTVLPVNDAPNISLLPNHDLGNGGMVAIDLRSYVHDVDNNITELIFNTNSPRAVTVGYMLILSYAKGDPSEIVTLTVNDTETQSSGSFRVDVSKTDDHMDWWASIIWPWSLLILLVIGAIGAVVYNRVLDRRFTVEDVFMVGKEGRLMMHSTRRLRADMDDDVLAGMLTAIMMFVKDSFREEGEDLHKFEFGNKQVLVERGSHFYIAAMYAGEVPETAPESLYNLTQDIQEELGELLSEWTGDTDDIKGLKVFMDAFVFRRRYRRGDWKRFALRRKAAL